MHIHNTIAFPKNYVKPNRISANKVLTIIFFLLTKRLKIIKFKLYIKLTKHDLKILLTIQRRFSYVLYILFLFVLSTSLLKSSLLYVRYAKLITRDVEQRRLPKNQNILTMN